eukprot:239071-Prorocentrum_minimum.AAC.1
MDATDTTDMVRRRSPSLGVDTSSPGALPDMERCRCAEGGQRGSEGVRGPNQSPRGEVSVKCSEP